MDGEMQGLARALTDR